MQDTELNLTLEVQPARGGALASGYVDGADQARVFYEGWWGDPTALDRKADQVSERFDRAARERAARALRSPTARAADRLRDWVERGGFAVTTGQQPGLFTGPLYTIYKALTAARLAEALEARLGVPVLPIFWVASEDHDWEESGRTHLIGVDNELHGFEVPAPPDQAGRPIHRIRPGRALADVLEAFLAEWPESDFSGPFRELLTSAYTPEATLSEAFGATLGALLAPFGVFMADAGDPAIKEASAPLLALEIERAEAHEALLTERADAIEAAGFPLQVPVLPGALNLFAEGPAGRERIYRDGPGAFALRHSEVPYAGSALRDRLEREPGTLSPNVLLRPVVESAAFPTLSIVVGPGEAAYFAQLAPYFRTFGIEPPVVWPRFSVTVIEAKVGKVFDRFGLGPRELARPFHELASVVARDELPAEATRALSDLRAALDAGSRALTEAVSGIHKTLAGPIGKARGTSFGAWAEAEKKIVQAIKRENETRLTQLEKAQRHVYPDGKPQERVLNAFYYLARYGEDFLRGLARRFEIRLDGPRDPG